MEIYSIGISSEKDMANKTHYYDALPDGDSM